MKRTFIIAVVLVNAFMACKKADRVCECNVTKTGSSSTKAALTFSIPIIGSIPLIDTTVVTSVTDIFTYERTLEDVTKKQAKNNCLSYNEPYKDITTNSAPPLTLVTTETGTRTYDCKLK